jgi:hypothetical protein
MGKTSGTLHLTPASSMAALPPHYNNMITALTPKTAQNVATGLATPGGVALATGAAIAVAPVSTLELIGQVVTTASANPYIIGAFYLLMNLGGRYLSLELTKKQEAFLQWSYLRPILLFAVLFIATRNFVVAFVGTLIVFFVLWVAANENSPYCMIPHWCGHTVDADVETYKKNIKTLFGGA